MTDLGTINDDPCSIAHAINIRDQVVGTSTDCQGNELHGFVWQPGGLMIDLNAFVPPASDLIVTDGESINDRGEISASGMLPNGNFHAVLLIPCGEDQTDTEGCVASTAKSVTQINSAPTAKARTKLDHAATAEMLANWRTSLGRGFPRFSRGTPAH
jgi:probable HAF family extracellular repeat protein